MQIPVDSITVPERVRQDPGNLESLMASLKRVGQLNPILVTPTYELIAGFRRLTAAQELGWQSVEVEVVQAADEVRRLEMELEENVYRKDFTPEEILAGYKKLEKLRHPSVGRRLRKAIGAFFSHLAFWRRRKKPSGSEAAAEAAAAEAAADREGKGEPSEEADDENLGV